MKLDDLKNKKILIVGYGIEGKSVEAFLKRKIPRVTIGITDQSSGPYYLEKQHEYDLAIKSPGVKKSLITIPYTTATNIFFANIQNKIIAVTGSKGKSTTTSLIHHILITSGKKSHLVGNVGVCALELLMSPINKSDSIVIELSSYQLDDIGYSPHIAVITSIFPEHMDYHGSIDLYYSAKKKILSYSSPDDIVIFNSKYEYVKQWMRSVSCKKIDVRGLLLGEVQTELIGEHNHENILLAYATTKELGISHLQTLNAISTFKSLPHRLEKVGMYNGILFYNDAISTTPESTIAAINSLSSIDTLLLGGQDRGYNFTQLVDRIMQSSISNLVLFPESSEKMHKILQSRSINTFNILKTDKMKEAVSFAFKHTKKGCICLLSTASPSYSVWKNYIEKGNMFKKYIAEYEKK